MQNRTGKIIADYELKAQEIISKMLRVLIRAHRKIDDKDYRDTINKLKEI